MLAGAGFCAGVGVELSLKIVRGILDAAQQGRGSLKLLTARRASSYARGSANVLHDPYRALGRCCHFA
jgi:hypothetical protein